MLEVNPLLKKLSLVFQNDQLLHCNVAEDIESKKAIINEGVKHSSKEFHSFLNKINRTKWFHKFSRYWS